MTNRKITTQNEVIEAMIRNDMLVIMVEPDINKAHVIRQMKFYHECPPIQSIFDSESETYVLSFGESDLWSRHICTASEFLAMPYDEQAPQQFIRVGDDCVEITNDNGFVKTS